MAKKDQIAEEKQLEEISAQIKEKVKEVREYDKHMEEAQKQLDDQRKDIKEVQAQTLKEAEELRLLREEFEEKRKKLDDEAEGLKMKKVSLDRVAEASDERLTLAKAQDKANQETLREIDKREKATDNTQNSMQEELENRLRDAENLEKLRNDEVQKAQIQLKALQAEREDIALYKKRHSDLLKEVEDTKIVLAAQLSQTKDKEQELRDAKIDFENRQHNLDLREKKIKEDEIVIQATWAKINRKIEIMGLKKELEEEGITVADGTKGMERGK